MGQFPHDRKMVKMWHFFKNKFNLRDNGATKHHHNHHQCHQLRTALARVLDELGPKRKHF